MLGRFCSHTSLWSLTFEDRSWLRDAVLEPRPFGERRIALTAWLGLVPLEARASEADGLRPFIADEELLGVIDDELRPRTVSDAEREYERSQRRFALREQKRQENSLRGWKEFRERLSAKSDLLRSPDAILIWPGPAPLQSLNSWISHRRGIADSEAAPHWRDLIPSFGREIAEAFRDGMITGWRLWEPARPTYLEGGRSSRSWTAILAVSGLTLLAQEEGWTEHLKFHEGA